MKYGFIILLVAVFGISEYALVELYPLPQNQRTAKIEQLPIVRSVLKASAIRKINHWIEKSDSSSVYVDFKGERFRWDNARVLYDEFESGHKPAELAIRFIKGQIRFEPNPERHSDVFASYRQRALEGDFLAAQQLYRLALYVEDPILRDEAIEIIRGIDSPHAKWVVQQLN